MIRQAPSPILSNVQVELLKLYAANVSDEVLLDLKKVMSKLLMQKMREEAGKIWVEKGYGQANINEWLGKKDKI